MGGFNFSFKEKSARRAQSTALTTTCCQTERLIGLQPTNQSALPLVVTAKQHLGNTEATRGDAEHASKEPLKNLLPTRAAAVAAARIEELRG